MSSCATGTSWKTLTRSGAMVVVFGLGLASSGISYAADGGASTVRAVIAGDGKVTSVSQLGGDSASKPSAGDLPITVGITKTGDTVTYAVANTTGKSEPINVTADDGTVKTVQQDVQTPYVAMLHVSLPASLKDVSAPGASVVLNADGSHELTWSMVLFSPIGAPTQQVTYTATGKGDPTARLESQAVSPNGTPGLSGAGQAANAVVAGNGTLGALTAGANTGLGQLSAGVAQIIAGLEKLNTGANALHTGLAAGADGTNQLAAGLHTAHSGSTKLTGGLGQLSDGTGQLAAGTGKLRAGAGKLVAGLQAATVGSDALVNGSQDLATGAGLTAAGAQSLSDGLQLISGGLGQLGATAGLPAAKIGAVALKAGVDKLLAGLGSPTATGTILNGLAGLGTGLTTVKAGLDRLVDPATGLPVAVAGVDKIKGVIDAQLLPGLGKPDVPGKTVRYAVEQVRLGLAVAIATGGSLDKLRGATAALAPYISTTVGGPCAVPFPVPPSPPTTPCQILATVYYGIGAIKSSSTTAQGALSSAGNGLTDITGGLGQLSTGLRSGDPANPGVGDGLDAAVTGLQQLDAGVGEPTNGAASIRGGLALVNGGVLAVTAGLKSGDPAHPGISEGLDALIAGLTTAITGVDALSSGAASAAAGSIALADGTRQVADGAGQLSEEGAVPISDGLHQLLAGGRLAGAGVDQLDAGAGKLNSGARQAFVGSQALDAGIGKISSGEDQVAAGLPAAVTGSGQIADGASQLLTGNKGVAKGLSDVKGQATGILASQLTTGTQNAKVQLAALDASSARLTGAVATTTYVLTQEADGKPVATKLSRNDNHVARNIGIGVGGAVLLLGGLAAGFAGGRRNPG